MGMDFSPLQTVGVVAGVLVAAIVVLTSAASLVAYIFKVGSWKGGVDAFIVETRDALRTIQDDIRGILGKIPSPAIAESSPLHLTDLGKEIAEEIHAEEWAGKLAPLLGKKVKGQEPYQIQDFCYQYVLSPNELNLDPEMMIEVRKCSYEKGVKEEEVLKVLWVVLRDELLSVSGPGPTSGS